MDKEPQTFSDMYIVHCTMNIYFIFLVKIAALIMSEYKIVYHLSLPKLVDENLNILISVNVPSFHILLVNPGHSRLTRKGKKRTVLKTSNDFECNIRDAFQIFAFGMCEKKRENRKLFQNWRTWIPCTMQKNSDIQNFIAQAGSLT